MNEWTKFITVNNVLTRLLCVTVDIPNAPLWFGIINNTPYGSTAANTSIRRCLKSFTSCISVRQIDSLLNYAADSVLSLGMFGGHKSGFLTNAWRLSSAAVLHGAFLQTKISQCIRSITEGHRGLGKSWQWHVEQWTCGRLLQFSTSTLITSVSVLFSLPLSCLRSVLHVFVRLLNNVSNTPSVQSKFYPLYLRIQPAPARITSSKMYCVNTRGVRSSISATRPVPDDAYPYYPYPTCAENCYPIRPDPRVRVDPHTPNKNCSKRQVFIIVFTN